MLPYERTHRRTHDDALAPHCVVSVLGSLHIQILMPSPDGISLMPNTHTHTSPSFQEWISSLQVIRHTAVPLIKLTTAPVPTRFGDTRGVIKIDVSLDWCVAGPRFHAQCSL
jgi:hypothetical protein